MQRLALLLLLASACDAHYAPLSKPALASDFTLELRALDGAELAALMDVPVAAFTYHGPAGEFLCSVILDYYRQVDRTHKRLVMKSGAVHFEDGMRIYMTLPLVRGGEARVALETESERSIMHLELRSWDEWLGDRAETVSTLAQQRAGTVAGEFGDPFYLQSVAAVGQGEPSTAWDVPAGTLEKYSQTLAVKVTMLLTTSASATPREPL